MITFTVPAIKKLDLYKKGRGGAFRPLYNYIGAFTIYRPRQANYTRRAMAYIHWQQYVCECARAAHIVTPIVMDASHKYYISTIVYFATPSRIFPDPENVRKGIGLQFSGCMV